MMTRSAGRSVTLHGERLSQPFQSSPAGSFSILYRTTLNIESIVYSLVMLLCMWAGCMDM